MSTPSKKRLAARAWMTRIVKQHERDAVARVNEARSRSDREWRAKLTRIIPPEDGGMVYPQGRLEKPYILVMAPAGIPDYATPYDPTNFENRERMRQEFFDTEHPIRVDAKQMAHVLPNGSKLVWWTWEVRR